MEERFFSPTSNNSELFGSVETFSSNQDLQGKEGQSQINRSQQSLDEQVGSSSRNLGQLLDNYNSNKEDINNYIKQQQDSFKQNQLQQDLQLSQQQSDKGNLPVISEFLEQRGPNTYSKSYQQYLQDQVNNSSLDSNLEAQKRILLNSTPQKGFFQGKQNPYIKYYLDQNQLNNFGSNHTLSQVYQGIQNQNQMQYNNPYQEDKQAGSLLKKFSSMRVTEPQHHMSNTQRGPQLSKTTSDVSQLFQGVQNQRYSQEDLENLLQRSLQSDQTQQSQEIFLNLLDNQLKQSDKNDFSGLNSQNLQLKNTILRQLYQSQSENFEPQRRLQNLELLGGIHPKALSDLSSYFSLLSSRKEAQPGSILHQDSSLSYQSHSDLPLPSQRQLDNKALRIHGFSESINPKEAKSAVLTALKICAPQVASNSCLMQVIDMRVKSTVRGQHVGSKYVIMDFKEEKFCSWCKQLLESFKIPRGQRLLKRDEAEALSLEVADQLPDYESYLDTEVTLVVYYANIKLKQTDKQQGLKQKFQQRGNENTDRSLNELQNKLLQQQLLQEQAKYNQFPNYQQQAPLGNLFQNPGQSQQYPFLDMDLTQQNQLNLNGQSNVNPFAQPLFEDPSNQSLSQQQLSQTYPQNPGLQGNNLQNPNLQNLSLQNLDLSNPNLSNSNLSPQEIPGSSSKIIDKSPQLPQLRLNLPGNKQGGVSQTQTAKQVKSGDFNGKSEELSRDVGRQSVQYEQDTAKEHIMAQNQYQRGHNQCQGRNSLEGVNRAQEGNYTQLLNQTNANSLSWQQNHAVSADSFFLKSLAEELEEQQTQKDSKQQSKNQQQPSQDKSVVQNQEYDAYMQNVKTFQDRNSSQFPSSNIDTHKHNNNLNANNISTPQHQQPQNFYDNLFSPPQDSQTATSDRWAHILGEQPFSPQSDQGSGTPTILSPPQKSFNDQENLEVTVDPRVLRVCGFKQCMKSREVRAAIVTIIFQHSYLSQYISKIKDIRVKVTRDGQYVGYKYGIVDFEEEKISKDVKMRMDGMEIEQGTVLVGQDQLASTNIKKQILVYLPQKTEEMRCSVKLCIYYANIRQKSLQDHNSQRSSYVTYYVNDPYKPHKVVTQKPSLGSNSKSEPQSSYSGQHSYPSLQAQKSTEASDKFKQAQDSQQRQAESIQNQNSQLYMQLQANAQLFGQDTTGFESQDQKNEYVNKENRYHQNYQQQYLQPNQQPQQYWNNYNTVQQQYNLMPQNLSGHQPSPQYQLPKFSSLPPNFYNQ